LDGVDVLSRSLLVLLFVFACRPVEAQSADPISADRPGLADSSTVIAKGALQLESGVEWDKRESEISAFVPLLFRVGVSKWLEARVEGSAFDADEAGGHWQNGIGAWSVGAKAVLFHDKGRRPQAGIIGRLFPPSGTGAFASELTTGDVRLVADWACGDHWSLNPNIGVGWYEGDSGRYTAGLFALTLSYEENPKVTWFVDTGGQTPEAEEGPTAVTVDGGVAYITRRNWQLDVSVGTRAHGETPPRPFIGLGLAIRSRR